MTPRNMAQWEAATTVEAHWHQSKAVHHHGRDGFSLQAMNNTEKGALGAGHLARVFLLKCILSCFRISTVLTSTKHHSPPPSFYKLYFNWSLIFGNIPKALTLSCTCSSSLDCWTWDVILDTALQDKRQDIRRGYADWTTYTHAKTAGVSIL